MLGSDSAGVDGAAVMVADPDARRRDALCADLRGRGLRCLCVGSGPAVLDRVSGADAVLLASDLPGIDGEGPVGLDCLAWLRQQYRLEQLPVIVMLPGHRVHDLDAVLRAGASDVVFRPLDGALVLGRLRTWLRMKAEHDTREHFMRIACHDLRSPLTRILTTADLVCELVPPGTVMTKELHRLLGGVSDSAMRMGRIIEDFIELQALQDGALSLRLASVDVCELLRSTLEHNLPWATHQGIMLRLDAAGGCMVQADRAHLESVVNKLVDNAVEYSPVGSTIQLRCQAVGDRVQIDVVDQGPELCADDLGRVFQSYARLVTRPPAGESSSGLGLAIAREIVELHGGSIGLFNNDPGPGATFWVSLKRTT